MAAIDHATVKKIANLARIRVKEDETDRYANQIGGIMQWVEQLGQVNTDQVEPLSNVANIDLAWREDKVTDGGIQKDVLANAPESLEGFYVVPKIVE